MKKLALLLTLPALCAAAPAFAHFNLQSPTPNTTTTDGGMGSPPCGIGTASNVITPVTGGHTITLKIDEFVGHTGFYRVALALNSPSELPVDNVVKDSGGNILPPSGKPNGTSASADFESPPVFPVLQDNLFPHQAANGDQIFQMDLTVPNVTCEKCTLQVIEFMQGHPFNTASPPDTGPGGGYFYHHCADLKITADPALPPFGGGGAGGAGTGGTSSAGGAGATSSAGGSVSASGGAGGAATTGTAGRSNASAGANAGGASSTGGAGVTSGGGTSTTSPSPSSDSSGCSYASTQRTSSRAFLAALFGLAAFGVLRRRRRAH